jgi:hypothetical protein
MEHKRYVFDENPKIRRKIQSDLSQIIDELKFFPQIVSIVLGGGFGRGEGSILIEKGKVKPLNDYDIYIFVNKEIDKNLIYQIEKKLAEKLEIIWVDIQQITYSKIKKLKPHQYIFDIKYGGRVIYGKNILSELKNFQSEEIPLDSAEKLLMTRLWCLFQKEKGFFYNQQIVKAVLALEEAILILNKDYTTSYEEKLEKIKKYTDDRYYALFKWATLFKLKPNKRLKIKPEDYIKIRRLFLKTLLEVGKKLYNFSKTERYYNSYIFYNFPYLIYRQFFRADKKYGIQIKIKFAEFYLMLYYETKNEQYLKACETILNLRFFNINNLHKEILDLHHEYIK